MPRASDLLGMRFGRLTVIERAERVSSGKRYRVAWHCLCECGTRIIRTADALCEGRLNSCGCLNRLRPMPISAIAARTVHGATKTPEHRVWACMLDRCCNQRSRQFRHYGGRGITVCDRWRFGENGQHPFECFLADVGRRPSPKLSIDRIDNNDGYRPGNVRWATQTQQRRNTRVYKGFSEIMEKHGVTLRQAKRMALNAVGAP